MDFGNHSDTSDPFGQVPDHVILRTLLLHRPHLLQQSPPAPSRDPQGDLYQFLLSSRSTSAASDRLSGGDSLLSFPSTEASSVRSSAYPPILETQQSAFGGNTGPQRQGIDPLHDNHFDSTKAKRTAPGSAQSIVTSRNASVNKTREEVPQERRPLRFFCTYCHELGISKTFKTKSDWKRHEHNFHETGEEWRCAAEFCDEIFTRAVDYIKHIQDAHHGLPYPDNAKTTLPDKQAFGCGFEDCKSITGTWKDRCDHVAKCMQAGNQWTYSTRVRNLLRQKPVSERWKFLRDQWCRQLGIRSSALRWDPSTSRVLIQRLEYGYFEPNQDESLQTIAKLGVQRHVLNTPDILVSQTAIDPSPIQPSETPGQWNINPELQFYHSAPELAPSSDKRASAMMSDAPPLTDFGPGDTGSQIYRPNANPVPTQGISNPEMFSAQLTTPLSDHGQFEFLDDDYYNTVSQKPSKSTSLKRSVHRVKSGLSPKKSQQFQPARHIDHPDLPSQYHLPASGSHSPMSPTPAATDTSLDSNQTWHMG